MRSDSVVPHNHRPRRPLDARLQVLRKSNVVVQELEQEIRLLLLEAHNPPCELRVHKQGLFACRRVCAYNRVCTRHGLTTHNTAARSRVLRLLVARMDGFEAVQSLLELGRQAAVCFRLVAEACVAACAGPVEKVQERCAWRLQFECHVRVPRDRVCAFLEVVARCRVSCRPMYQMHLGVALWCTAGLVDVGGPVVFGKVYGFLDREICKVLVAEGCIVCQISRPPPTRCTLPSVHTDNLFLGHKQRQLILSGFVKLAQLYALDLCSDIGTEILHLGTFEQA